MTSIERLLADSIAASVALKQKVVETLTAEICAAGELLANAYANGNKAIFFGNGGSAADAQHLAAELECRFAFDRSPLPALALHANTSTLTAISNDYDYEQVYARLLAAHARPGDVAVALSTSGTSKNVIAAARLKEKLQIKLIALTGENGAALSPFADCVIAVPSRDTPRIQEAHITIGHVLCEWVEHAVFRGRGRGQGQGQGEVG
jgi:D-sedoheptulose 7-phosphate isomerase